MSTETLEFGQDQTLLTQELARIGGSKYILRAPTSTVPGVAVVTDSDKNEVEILIIETSPGYNENKKYLNIVETVEDIRADGVTYKGARTIRTARFSDTAQGKHYVLAEFDNIKGKVIQPFPTNAILAAQIEGLDKKILGIVADAVADKLTARDIMGLTQKQLDDQRTPIMLACAQSFAACGMADYTLIVSQQGRSAVRQEIIQGQNQHYVRTHDGRVWGKWEHQTETAVHLDVKMVRNTLYLRHGAIGDDVSIVLLRKKRRSAKRHSGGSNSYAKHKGKASLRSPKKQYVHFKGITLSKGEPGKWYVPKCIGVADPKVDGWLVGKELPTLCDSVFYVGGDGTYRIQGSRTKIVLKSTTNRKGTRHGGYAQLGVQIARLRPTGGKDGGGEICRIKYRISQVPSKLPGPSVYGRYYVWQKSFSID